MYEDLVTIAVFHSQTEFLLARTRLESAAIECFAYDEHDARAVLHQTARLDNP